MTELLSRVVAPYLLLSKVVAQTNVDVHRIAAGANMKYMDRFLKNPVRVARYYWQYLRSKIRADKSQGIADITRAVENHDRRGCYRCTGKLVSDG